MDRFKKIGFGAFAFLALVFGAVQLSQNLKLTFMADSATKADESAAGDQAFADAKLKVLDTDGDGITDWQELNSLGTSPYLADSDSDGVADNVEISQGTDPNCPKGKECGSGGLQKPPAVTPPTDASLPAKDTLAPAANEQNVLTPEDQQALQALSPQDIRDLLRQGGVTDEQMQDASDDDLRKLLEETIKQPQ